MLSASLKVPVSTRTNEAISLLPFRVYISASRRVATCTYFGSCKMSSGPGLESLVDRKQILDYLLFAC